MAIDMGIRDLACYSDSLLSINLIKGGTLHYHIYVVLIQNINDMLPSNNFSVHHTLRKGNQSADFLAKMGSTSDVGFVIHSSSILFRVTPRESSSLRPSSLSFLSFFVLFSFVFD